MTEEELLKEMRRMGHAHQEPPPLRRAAVWERIQTRRAADHRRALPRRVVFGLLASAAVLVLLLGAIRAHRRANDHRPDQTMAAASAIVVRRHLAESDTMIRAFRTAVASGTWDDHLTAQARDLELATRRIQGGRIVADSALAGLLTDLDLVLTEIVGYGDLTAGRAGEYEMIEYSIAERQVIPRLRTASADAAVRAAGNEGLNP